MVETFRFKMIVSGGQTGVDRAALDFALQHGIRCGGWCPLGRQAEDGVIDDKYPLKENSTSNVEERTMLNVRDSDVTLVLLFDYPPDPGTQFTMKQCQTQSRPLFVYRDQDDINKLKAWLTENHTLTLNIAGPRESNAPGIYFKTTRFLENYLI